MKKVILIFLFLIIAIITVSGYFIFKEKNPIPNKKKGGENNIMKNKRLGKILMIIAPKDFRDEEYLIPHQIFNQGGFEVEVASKEVTEAIGMFNTKVKIDKDVSQVNLDDYQGIVFVGGKGASIYFNDPIALNLAKKSFAKGKVIGAICIAPSILANAGILKNKKATAYPTEQSNLNQQGALYTNEAVTIDDKIITGQGPKAAQEFAKKILSALQID
jgi:protease I